MDEYEPNVAIDDDSIPLWVRIEEAMRLLDTALREAKSRGRVMVEKEARYYSAKAQESFDMLEAGFTNTYIQTVIKGRPKVAKAMSEYHEAEVLYKNANEALQVVKLKLRVLEAEMEREWNNQNRM